MNGKSTLGNNIGFATTAIHNKIGSMKLSIDPVIPGIMTSTSYIHEFPGITNGYDYSRSNNPTRHLLETSLADLENAQYGMAAITSLMYLLENGDEIVSIDDVYSRTAIFFKSFLSKWGVIAKMIDMGNDEILKSSLSSKTKMLFIECPTNPQLKIVDIKKITKIAKEFNPRIITVVDNTFLSPYFQKPLELGADISVYSLSKYINGKLDSRCFNKYVEGHFDVVMGGVMLNDDSLYDRIKHVQATVGAVPSPIDCYLVSRGIKTLALRMQRHHDTGLKIAQFLENNPFVDKVYYPELPSHPSYELFKKQSSGMSGIITFLLKGSVTHANKFVTSLKLFKLAVSLGGFESLAEIPASMTHGSIPLKEQLEVGLLDTMDADDLIDDIKRAFNETFSKELLAN